MANARRQVQRADDELRCGIRTVAEGLRRSLHSLSAATTGGDNIPAATDADNNDGEGTSSPAPPPVFLYRYGYNASWEAPCDLTWCVPMTYYRIDILSYPVSHALRYRKDFLVSLGSALQDKSIRTAGQPRLACHTRPSFRLCLGRQSTRGARQVQHVVRILWRRIRARGPCIYVLRCCLLLKALLFFLSLPPSCSDLLLLAAFRPREQAFAEQIGTWCMATPFPCLTVFSVPHMSATKVGSKRCGHNPDPGCWGQVDQLRSFRQPKRKKHRRFAGGSTYRGVAGIHATFRDGDAAQYQRGN